jgi:hypothetical protein
MNSRKFTFINRRIHTYKISESNLHPNNLTQSPLRLFLRLTRQCRMIVWLPHQGLNRNRDYEIANKEKTQTELLVLPQAVPLVFNTISDFMIKSLKKIIFILQVQPRFISFIKLKMQKGKIHQQ